MAFLIGLTPLAGAFYLLAHADAKHERRDAFERQTQAVQQLAAQERVHLEGIRRLAQVVSLRVAESGADYCDQDLAVLMEAEPGIINIGVADRDGNITCSAVPLSGPVSIADRTYFRRTIENDGFSPGDLQVGRVTNRFSVNFGYPVRADDGSIQGVAFVAIDAAWWADRMEAYGFGRGTIALVVDDGDLVVASTVAGMHPTGAPAPVTTERAPKQDHDANVWLGRTNGTHAVWAREPIALADPARLSVLLATPAAAALEDVHTPGEEVFALFASAIVIGLLVVMVAAQRLVLGPLHALQGTAKRLKDGDLEATTVHEPMAAEFHELAATLDEMALRVRTTREQERLERESLERSNRELEETLKWRTVFVTTVAHDLGSPLSPIQLQLELLRQDPREPLGPAQAARVEIIERNAGRIQYLVQDLTEVSRLHSGRLKILPEPVELSGLIEGALASYRPEAEQRAIRLRFETEGPLPLHADPYRVEQVLGNLVHNAMKFTPNGREVVVRVRREPERALVEVQDEGVGIPAKDLGRLFEPFSQVQNPMQRKHLGSGLGLYITKGIVEHHGGEVWVKSDGPGRGSTFGFWLPIMTQEGGAG